MANNTTSGTTSMNTSVEKSSLVLLLQLLALIPFLVLLLQILALIPFLVLLLQLFDLKRIYRKFYI